MVKMSQKIISCVVCLLLVFHQSCCAAVPKKFGTNSTAGSVTVASKYDVRTCELNLAMDRVVSQYGESLETLEEIQPGNYSKRQPSSTANKLTAFIDGRTCDQLNDDATRQKIASVYSGFNSNLAVGRNESQNHLASKFEDEYNKIDTTLYDLQRSPTGGVMQVVNIVDRSITSKLRPRKNKKSHNNKCLKRSRGRVRFIGCLHQVVAQDAVDAVAIHGAFAKRMTFCGIPTQVTSCSSAPSQLGSSDDHSTPTYAIILAVVSVVVALCLIGVVYALICKRGLAAIAQKSVSTAELGHVQFFPRCPQSPIVAITMPKLCDPEHQLLHEEPEPGAA